MKKGSAGKNALKHFRHEFRKSAFFQIKLDNQFFVRMHTKIDKVNDSQVADMVNAVNKLNENERRILFLKFLDVEKMSNTRIWLELCISERTYYRKLDHAYIHFEESFFKD